MVFTRSFIVNLTSVNSMIFIHIIVDVSSGGTIDQSILLLCMQYMSNKKKPMFPMFQII